MEGYAKIAAFMGQHPESALVLRFSDINLQNILYLQAEIYGLREDLRRVEARNQAASSNEDMNAFSLDWATLAQTKIDGESNQQWEMVKRLRVLLKEYNEAVLQFHQMSQIPSPRPRDLQRLLDWLRRPMLGAVYLTGRDRNVWVEGSDLMALGKHPSKNQFTSWISDRLLPLYHRVIGRHSSKHESSVPQLGMNIAEYSDSGIAKVANLVGTVLASVLPVLAIVVLYLLKGVGIRLGLVGIFSALFSTCLWFLNDGSLVEVFSATSAFAAVQVVFIGTSQ